MSNVQLADDKIPEAVELTPDELDLLKARRQDVLQLIMEGRERFLKSENLPSKQQEMLFKAWLMWRLRHPLGG
jgi:hypothetical protein